MEDEKEPEPSFSESDDNPILASAETSVLDSGLTSEQHFVTLKFGEEMKKKFQPDVPISGRVSQRRTFAVLHKIYSRKNVKMYATGQ